MTQVLIPIKNVRLFTKLAVPPSALSTIPDDELMVLLEPVGNVSAMCIKGSVLAEQLKELMPAGRGLLELLKRLQEQTEHEVVVALDPDKAPKANWKLGIRPKVAADAKPLVPPVYLESP